MGPTPVMLVSDEVAALRPPPGRPVSVGLTGGVAVGKSSLAEAVARELEGRGRGPVAVVASDGYLLANDELAARGLTHRKGFPESFDPAGLRRLLGAVEAREAAHRPSTYSHRVQDVAGPGPPLGRPVVVVVEGLHLGHPGLGVRDRFDLLVHLDADDDVLERWFLERFHEQRREAADDPGAYLHAVSGWPIGEIEPLALAVWRDVNLAVLHTEVRPRAGEADLVVHLDAEHQVRAVDRPGAAEPRDRSDESSPAGASDTSTDPQMGDTR